MYPREKTLDTAPLVVSESVGGGGVDGRAGIGIEGGEVRTQTFPFRSKIYFHFLPDTCTTSNGIKSLLSPFPSFSLPSSPLLSPSPPPLAALTTEAKF